MVALVVGVWLAVPVGFAQQRAGPRPGFPRYNPATEVTAKGIVEEVKEKAGPMGWPGTHLTIKTDKEALDVHVGPSDFRAQNKWQFAKGETIEVTGSKVKVDGADSVVAREIKKGGKSLTLRDARGIPQWSRGHRWKYVCKLARERTDGTGGTPAGQTQVCQAMSQHLRFAWSATARTARSTAPGSPR